MQILVVNQYFHPDRSATSQLLTELCEDLSEHHEITVVCGRPSYDPSERTTMRGLLAEDHHGEVRILRSWSTTYARRRMVGRLTNYTTYLTSSIVGAMKAARPDVVLTMTDPPVVAAAAAAASAIRRVPFVYVNQDVFPEVGVVLGKLRNATLVRALSALNRSLRGRAARVIAIGRDMERRLVTLGTDPAKIYIIPNWADGSAIRPLEGSSRLREEHGWETSFVVMHSGNVGLSQDLGTLLSTADLLRDEPDLVFAIVGEGATKAELQAAAARRRLPNVEFLPYRPKEDLTDSLGAADLHIVGLRRGLAGYIVPSKVYGIIAAGKPFIAGVESGAEPGLIAEEYSCGIRVEPGDPAALSAAIVGFRQDPDGEMGSNGRRAFEEHFDRPIATEAYRHLLESVV
jgi:putative colanic acid biosynthesis glycosyltransferase WcaI